MKRQDLQLLCCLVLRTFSRAVKNLVISMLKNSLEVYERF